MTGKRAVHRWGAWLLLGFTVAATFLVVFLPAWFIQPFRGQTPRAIALSYLLRSWSPVVTLVTAGVTIILVVWLWRGKRSWWRHGLLAIALVPVGAAAWVARQNHFEWMFNPLTNPAYTRAAEASFVGDGDLVMAVEVNGEAVAYPVRQLAYHHVVHDTVGGVPLVVTY